MKRRKPVASPTFRRTADVLTWIRTNVKPYDANSGKDLPAWTQASLKKAALWWHAYEEASAWSDLRTKDIASILQTGLKPLTLADLQETLDSAHESEDDSLTAAQDIETNLRTFFNSRLEKRR